MTHKHKSVKKMNVPLEDISLTPHHKRMTNVEEKALNYRITKNLSALAEPKRRNIAKNEEQTYAEKNQRALKYKASARIKRLAMPKYSASKSEESKKASASNAISAKALKYMPTQRILELAQPVYKICKPYTTD